jgi:uncharacterized DUF497 family protein
MMTSGAHFQDSRNALTADLPGAVPLKLAEIQGAGESAFWPDTERTQAHGEWFQCSAFSFADSGTGANEKAAKLAFPVTNRTKPTPIGLRQPVYICDIYNAMAGKDPLAACVGFEWDDANITKNWQLQRVTPEEAEDIFFHDPFVLRSDPAHSRLEKRYFALGQTSAGRRLFIAFTIRKNLIRAISARDMSFSPRHEPERKPGI